ncbi:MAG: hydrogenase maturation nickel metallochaperone HypA [Lachnospiraceae bacterium]|uniref:Hydrogenase maturation factor HypA n=1 Tax=Candidatus Weimeria bifida TaxID=2599074 RepID=A0A6N7J037_9FIRM|nr:hydrogenase maturation nickel metallochaperone HypA [Candidatus Weimeria bifida]RRF95032.1 MAG: hydrogenase maturation nickel metallochaperone HypA [Lachnospiraceae bacterium]
MHELSYMMRMVDTALEACKKNDLKKVTEMEISVGEATGLIPHYLKDYYPKCVKGTILEGSDLTVHFIPVMAKCSDCGSEYQPSKENDYRCPNCKSFKAVIVHGREFTLNRLTGE